ncbi:TonB-dependent receptor plug domain-containing protein [Phenylobacterium sp.]|uniref:TonB-dependent receptor plug domain-containing protein n=1 Tax=Phenylobacterium sp. TaxID=1871053 RepID=UPI0035B244BB
MSKSRFLCSASAVAVAFSFAAASEALAQEPSTVQEVVVTGSFIKGTPEDAALPVDVISQEDLAKQGSPSTVELLKSLSVSSGVLGDTNQFDPRAQGSEGSGSVNLRGLGAQRTLVLINGRRMSANPFGQAGAGIVDTNIIPVGAIGRVEVLKDGAAATYGSDAIGGVVNFITRKNFNGLEANASFRAIDGSDGDYDGSVIWGWAGDNGDVLLSASYQHQSPLSTRERSWALRDYTQDPEGGWSGGSSVAPFIPIYQTATGAWAPAAAFQAQTADCSALGGVPIGGALPACNFRYTDYDNLVEKTNRFQLYGEANASLSDSIDAHFEAFYAETDVPEWHTSPSYLALQTPTVATNPTVGSLTSAVLQGFFVPSTNPGFIAYQAANPTQIPAFATGVHIPGVRYRPYAFGGNPMFSDGSSLGRRHYEAYRVSGGLKGEFSNGIGWDLALTYGQETGERTGYDTDVSRFQLALRGYGTLVTATDGGCTAAKTNNYTTGAGDASLGCYYFNPFGNSVPGSTGYSAATANNVDLVRWFFRQSGTKQTQRLFVADLVFNGETGIELPGGKVAWAAGGQFRRDGFTSSYDDLNNRAITSCVDTTVTGNIACASRNGPYFFLGVGEDADLESDVYALFTEWSVPATDSLQIQLAARYENYPTNGVGSTLNPKIALRWQLNDHFALRASAGTTFRGPPLTQLTNSNVTALSFIAGSFRAIDLFGNPDLKPEKAKTYSAGILFKGGGLKASIDYWAFDFDNPIIAEPSASIVSAMFPGGSTANCGLADYAGLQARFSFQGACSLSTIARVRTEYVNGPKVKTSGVDFMADYDFGEVLGGDLTVGGTATYTREYKIDNFVIEGVTVEEAYDAAGFLNYQLAATSLPQWKGQAYLQYNRGPHNLRLTLNYIGDYTDQRTSILTPNAVSGQVVSAGKTIDSTLTADLAYQAQLPWDTRVTLTINNLTDQDPSFARLDLNYDPFTGNPLGRTYKIAISKRF